MSLKNEKELMKKSIKNNDDDILVYEPIRRNCLNEENESTNKHNLTRKFTGLYNRGMRFLEGNFFKFLLIINT